MNKEQIINNIITLLVLIDKENNYMTTIAKYEDILPKILDLVIFQTLSEKCYGFCSKHAEPMLTGDIPSNPNFLYEYEIPKDCVKIWNVFGYSEEDDARFEINVSNKNQVVLNCNITPCIIKYSVRPENTDFPIEFAKELILNTLKFVKEVLNI